MSFLKLAGLIFWRHIIKTLSNNLAIITVLSIIGVATNIIWILYFSGFDLILAPFIALVAAVFLGPTVAFVVSLISSIPLLIFYNSFLPITFFGLEAIFVGLFFNKIRNNLVLTIVVFWLVVGLPLAWGYMLYWETTVDTQKVIFLLKRFFNAILYAHLATLIIASGIASKFLSHKKYPKNYSLHKKFAYQLSVIFVSAGLIILIYNLNNNTTKALQEQRTNQDLVHSKLNGEIKALMASRISSIKELAHTFGLVWNDPEARSTQLISAHKRLDYFNTMILANSDATVINISVPEVEVPDINKNKIDISDREYYKKSINSSSPYVSEGFLGRGFEKNLIAVISSSVANQHSGKNQGIVQGAMSLKKLTLLEKLFNESNINIGILLDQNNQVLFSSKILAINELEKVALEIKDSYLHKQQVAHVISDSHGSNGELYYFRESLFDWGWKLITLENDQVLATYIQNLLITFILILIVLAILSEMVASILSSFWTKQLRNLTSAVKFIGIEESYHLNETDLAELPQELKVLYSAIEESQKEIALVKTNNNQLIHANSKQVENINEKLRILESQDYLTKLYNRRVFNKQLNGLWKMRKKHKQLLSLIILKIDDFNSLNKERGYLAGDAVLTQLSEYLLSLKYSWIHCIGRVSGKEFGITSLEDTHIDTVAYAEVLQMDIANKKIILKKDNLFTMFNVTVSVGVVSIDPTKSSVENLYQIMDGALFKAKKKGKNKIEHINKTVLL